MGFICQLRRYLIRSTTALLLVLPSSANYKLGDYGFGSGGTTTSTSANYAAQGLSGEQGGPSQAGAGSRIGPGLLFTQQAQVPAAPTVSNPGGYYNKLLVTVRPGSNPTDTTFAIAASTDGFITTKYLKSDMTVGATLTMADYQTYSAWGGASGSLAIGLAGSSTYSFKAKARQGSFTETDYGPLASASTVSPSISFSLSVESQAVPPFSLGFGSLTAGAVTPSSQNGIIDLTTNASLGASAYISSQNGSLASLGSGASIPSVSGDLSALAQGYGAQDVSSDQASGGPLSMAGGFSGGGSVVGFLGNSPAVLFSSSGAITGGHGVFRLKVRPASSTSSANDYSDTLSIGAFANF